MMVSGNEAIKDSKNEHVKWISNIVNEENTLNAIVYNFFVLLLLDNKNQRKFV